MVVSCGNPKDNVRAVGLPRRDGGTWFPARVSGMSGRRQAAGRDCRSSLLVNICLRLKAPGSEGSPAVEDRVRENDGELNDKGGVLQGQGQSLGKLSLETWDTQKGKFLSFPASPSGKGQRPQRASRDKGMT